MDADELVPRILHALAQRGIRMGPDGNRTATHSPANWAWLRPRWGPLHDMRVDVIADAARQIQQCGWWHRADAINVAAGDARAQCALLNLLRDDPIRDGEFAVAMLLAGFRASWTCDGVAREHCFFACHITADPALFLTPPPRLL